ncbi:MAG: endonuclease/exonuclease/phosphatase family protein [Chitinophagaceae bacterium]
MASRFRIFTRRFFLICNIVWVLFFLLAALAPNLDPQRWWFLAFLGLIFPFLFLGNLCFLVGWLILRKRYALISAIALLLGFKSISVFFAFHPGSGFTEHKKKGDLRIATWNVARFIEMRRNHNKGSRTRLRMMEQIEAQNADVICMQEFFHSLAYDWYPNLTYISKNYNYPYYYFSHDVDGDNHFTGSVIFSRYPIIDSGLIRFPRPSLPEALMHADIKVNDDTIRVYTTHLQSVQFKKGDYQRIEEIKSGEDGLVGNSKTIFSKLRTGFSNRKIQVDIINQVLNDSPYPVIFCADLNDVPNSYAYYQVKADMQDAFLKKGFGIGRTFNALSPTLRIDYILADDAFDIRQFKRIVRDYSDHYMLVADMRLARDL